MSNLDFEKNSLVYIYFFNIDSNLYTSPVTDNSVGYKKWSLKRYALGAMSAPEA